MKTDIILDYFGFWKHWIVTLDGVVKAFLLEEDLTTEDLVYIWLNKLVSKKKKLNRTTEDIKAYQKEYRQKNAEYFRNYQRLYKRRKREHDRILTLNKKRKCFWGYMTANSRTKLKPWIRSLTKMRLYKT